jgi:hypothetical protein
MDRLTRFDFSKKTKDHVQVRTNVGAALTVLSLSVMAILFVGEVIFWRTTRVENHLLVDSGQGNREFDISLDVTFHALSCREVNVNSEDAKNVPYDESSMKLTKTAIPPSASAAASAIKDGGSGLPTGAGGGCRVAGSLHVRRVAGHVYVAAPRSLTNLDGRLVFAVNRESKDQFNASHTINHLAFGPKFPGQLAPLDGATSSSSVSSAANYQYHIKVVPTIYEFLGGITGKRTIDSQQFSASDFLQIQETSEGGQFIHPGIWFRYDFSPIMVRLVETRRSFLQFLTSLCAILGGVFAITGLFDTIAFRATENSKTK